MKKLEIQALWEDHPDLFQRAVELEHRSAANNRSVKGLGRNWSWESYRQQFLQEKSLEAAQITLVNFSRTVPAAACAVRRADAMMAKRRLMV